MTKKMLTMVGVFSLVACGGSGEPWHGAEPPDAGGGPVGIAGTWSSGSTGGTTAISEGGAETGGLSFGGAVPSGGYEAGGTRFDGGSAGDDGYGYGGETEVGGYGGTAVAGYGGVGVAGSGGYGPSEGGSSSDSLTCLQNVAHCFDAAANCYEYSPWSDCDQIVDVCAAMQMDCDSE
jgi:hypothetical protein